MKQILSPISNLAALCGVQKDASGKQCRWTTLCLQIPCDDGVILYHTLLGEMLLLTGDESANALSAEVICDELKCKWFLVPKDFDDCKFSEQCRTAIRLMTPPEDAITSFTILPTTDCNARCFYCYEMGRPRRMMSEETAHDVAAYILRVSKGKKLSLHWFGGEPLLNVMAIDTVVRDVKAAGRTFASSMISNSYLFNEAMVQKAATEWNLKSMQVTLDGTEEVYNQTKAYICKDGGSAFVLVLNAIDLLLNAGIRVSVRLNVDRSNMNDLMNLADLLAERFGGRENFSVYAHLLFDTCVKHGFKDMQEELACIMSLKKKLAALGLSIGKRALPRSVKINSCMMDRDNSRTIMPDGHIGKCEHFTEDHFIGTICSETEDQEMLKEFKVRRPPVKTCRTCAYQPLCMNLKECPNGGRPCTELERMQNLDELRLQILAAYRKEKEKTEQVPATEETGAGPENC